MGSRRCESSISPDCDGEDQEGLGEPVQDPAEKIEHLIKLYGNFFLGFSEEQDSGSLEDLSDGSVFLLFQSLCLRDLSLRRLSSVTKKGNVIARALCDLFESRCVCKYFVARLSDGSPGKVCKPFLDHPVLVISLSSPENVSVGDEEE